MFPYVCLLYFCILLYNGTPHEVPLPGGRFFCAKHLSLAGSEAPMNAPSVVMQIATTAPTLLLPFHTATSTLIFTDPDDGATLR